MKTFILASLAALVIVLGCHASPGEDGGRSNSTIPEESIQSNAV